MKNDFLIVLPVDIVKSTNPADPNEWRIGGYASTPEKDREDDEIIQKGLDISDFVNFGFFNLDHNNETILGYPDKTRCKVDSKGFYVEGTLLKGVKASENMWNLALALKKENAPRKLGFSVEGKVLERDELGRIKKAKVYNVAITTNPVNPTCTWEALVKSFSVPEKDDSFEMKSMEAGYGESSGSPLIHESLDGALSVLSKVIGDDEESKTLMKELQKRLEEKKALKKSELILYFQLSRGISYEDSVTLLNKLL